MYYLYDVLFEQEHELSLMTSSVDSVEKRVRYMARLGRTAVAENNSRSGKQQHHGNDQTRTRTTINLLLETNNETHFYNNHGILG